MIRHTGAIKKAHMFLEIAKLLETKIAFLETPLILKLNVRKNVSFSIKKLQHQHREPAHALQMFINASMVRALVLLAVLDQV